MGKNNELSATETPTVHACTHTAVHGWRGSYVSDAGTYVHIRSAASRHLLAGGALRPASRLRRSWALMSASSPSASSGASSEGTALPPRRGRYAGVLLPGVLHTQQAWSWHGILLHVLVMRSAIQCCFMFSATIPDVTIIIGSDAYYRHASIRVSKGAVLHNGLSCWAS